MEDAEDDLPEKWDRSHFLYRLPHIARQTHFYSVCGGHAKALAFPAVLVRFCQINIRAFSGFLLALAEILYSQPPVKSIPSTLEIPP